MSDLMKFPSGRSVGNCRKDAKRLAKQEQIPLHAAFDRVANVNGISQPWARALTFLNEVSYVKSVPIRYAIQAKYLKVGMLHVAEIKTGLSEISRIRSVQSISQESIQIDLGPEGHWNRIVSPDTYLDIPVLTCPKCKEDSRLSTDLHPGTSYVCCLECGYMGPEFLPRGDNYAVLAAIIQGWNNLARFSQ
jgi:hypothetical protein